MSTTTFVMKNKIMYNKIWHKKLLRKNKLQLELRANFYKMLFQLTLNILAL